MITEEQVDWDVRLSDLSGDVRDRLDYAAAFVAECPNCKTIGYYVGPSVNEHGDLGREIIVSEWDGETYLWSCCSVHNHLGEGTRCGMLKTELAKARA